MPLQPLSLILSLNIKLIKQFPNADKCSLCAVHAHVNNRARVRKERRKKTNEKHWRVSIFCRFKSNQQKINKWSQNGIDVGGTKSLNARWPGQHENRKNRSQAASTFATVSHFANEEKRNIDGSKKSTINSFRLNFHRTCLFYFNLMIRRTTSKWSQSISSQSNLNGKEDAQSEFRTQENPNANWWRNCRENKHEKKENNKQTTER